MWLTDLHIEYGFTFKLEKDLQVSLDYLTVLCTDGMDVEVSGQTVMDNIRL